MPMTVTNDEYEMKRILTTVVLDFDILTHGTKWYLSVSNRFPFILIGSSAIKLFFLICFEFANYVQYESEEFIGYKVYILNIISIEMMQLNQPFE